MNCWFWIILLCCASGRNGCGCGCMDGSRGNGGRNGNGCGCMDRDNDYPRRSSFTAPVSSNNDCGCGCDDGMMTSRGFAGFGDGGTCGCEEKCDCKKSD